MLLVEAGLPPLCPCSVHAVAMQWPKAARGARAPACSFLQSFRILDPLHAYHRLAIWDGAYAGRCPAAAATPFRRILLLPAQPQR